ncbi:DUF6907 domain-containing protein [Streptomyces albidoflavus]|uniref:DUF6907 domain-containing protein n=1 Tax=Streptomyces albidoflavus TaxID=1886 RepID=UPI0033C38DF1
MSERIVRIRTVDHGTIETPCPGWCTEDHENDPFPTYRVDIDHKGPDTSIPVPTSSGPRTLLTTTLTRRPFTELATGTGTFVNVEIDGDWYPMGPAGLDAMAAGLVEAAAALRRTARHLAALQARERHQ